MSERKLENEVVEWAKTVGGRALKLELKGLRGHPDRTITAPGVVPVYVELKTEDGEVSENQVYWLKYYQSCGYVAEVCRSLNEVKAAFERSPRFDA